MSGWTSYPPLSALTLHRAAGAGALADRPDVRRRVVDDGLGQLPDDDHPDARPGHDDVSPADDDLGDVHHRRCCKRSRCRCSRRPASCSSPICTLGTGFFIPEGWSVEQRSAARPAAVIRCLWQHLFWFYSHPAVYIMILPAMGMVSDIISCFARKPLFGYKPMVYSIAGIAGLGFIVWGHHMFVSGMNPVLGMTFMVATMIIALPSAIKVFNWLGTIWGAKIQFTTPMLFALSFVSMFIIGGLSGIFMAATPVDIFIHDTYFIVAHFHYVLFAGTAMGVFGAIYFWFPKMFGRMMNDGWGKVHFLLTFVFLNCVFYPMHILGMRRLPAAAGRSLPLRNIPAPAAAQPIHDAGVRSLMVATQVIFVFNFFWSIFFGPWRAEILGTAIRSNGRRRARQGTATSISSR